MFCDFLQKLCSGIVQLGSNLFKARQHLSVSYILNQFMQLIEELIWMVYSLKYYSLK